MALPSILVRPAWAGEAPGKRKGQKQAALGLGKSPSWFDCGGRVAKREDTDYRIGAAELYRLNVDRLKIVQTIQADYGKWMIGTLSVIHSGALYAIADGKLGESVSGNYLPSLMGLLLTLASALFIWTNFSLAIRLFEAWTDPAMLSDDAHWPTTSGRLKFWLPATMWLAVTTGVSSGLCIVWAAFRLAP